MSSRLVAKARMSGDSGSGRTLMKRMGIAATALALAATLTGCAGDDEPESLDTNEPATTPSVTSAPTSPSPSPTVDRDAWRSKLTNAQLREFDYALRTWK